MTRILVTNDDGVRSPGIHALAAALRGVGEVIVVATGEEGYVAEELLTPLEGNG